MDLFEELEERYLIGKRFPLADNDIRCSPHSPTDLHSLLSSLYRYTSLIREVESCVEDVVESFEDRKKVSLPPALQTSCHVKVPAGVARRVKVEKRTKNITN